MKGLKSLGRKVKQKTDSSRTKLTQRFGNTEQTIDPEFDGLRVRLDAFVSALQAALRAAQKFDPAAETSLIGKKNSGASFSLRTGEVNLSLLDASGNAPLTGRVSAVLSLHGHASQVFDTASPDASRPPGLSTPDDCLSAWTDSERALRLSSALGETSAEIRDAHAAYREASLSHHDVLEELLAEHAVLSKQVKDRDHILLLHDKHKTDAISSDPSDPRHAEIERRFETSRDEYQRVNSEVCDAMEKFLESGFSRAEGSQHAFIGAQFVLWSRIAASYRRVLDQHAGEAAESAARRRPLPQPKRPTTTEDPGKAQEATGEAVLDDCSTGDAESLADIVRQYGDTTEMPDSSPKPNPRDALPQRTSSMADDLLTSGLGPSQPFSRPSHAILLSDDAEEPSVDSDLESEDGVRDLSEELVNELESSEEDSDESNAPPDRPPQRPLPKPSSGAPDRPPPSRPGQSSGAPPPRPKKQ